MSRQQLVNPRNKQIWCSEHRLSIPDARLYNRSRIRHKRRIDICDDETKLVRNVFQNLATQGTPVAFLAFCQVQIIDISKALK